MSLEESRQPVKDWIKLIRLAPISSSRLILIHPLSGAYSKSGDEFIIERDIACVSGLLRSMLQSSGQWAELSHHIPQVSLSDIDSEILERIIAFMHYKKRWNGSPGPLPQFKIEERIAIALLNATNYLDM